MKDGLTKQDKIFVKEMVEHGNRTEAAKKAYKIKNYGYARVKGSEQLTKPNIKQAIQSLADRIPDDKLHKVLMEGLEAENNEKPDYSVRHKYLNTALDLKGYLSDDKNKTPPVINQILVQFMNENEGTNNSPDTN